MGISFKPYFIAKLIKHCLIYVGPQTQAPTTAPYCSYLVSELATKIYIPIIMLLANTYIALTTYQYFFYLLLHKNNNPKVSGLKQPFHYLPLL